MIKKGSWLKTYISDGKSRGKRSISLPSSPTYVEIRPTSRFRIA